MRTLSNTNPIDLFWNYYDELVKNHKDIAKISDLDIIRLNKFFSVMRYYINKRFEILEIQNKTNLMNFQRKRYAKKKK